MHSNMIAQRMTGQIEGPFCVFLIGMRINRPLKVHKWFPTAMAMARMLRELEAHKELGYLGGEAWFGRTTLSLQYWRSSEHLMDYARSKTGQHLPAWKSFTQRIGNSGDSGIWHETYSIKDGAYETIYHNMPPFGLGSVGTLSPATGHYQSAKDRMEAAKSGPAAEPGADGVLDKSS